VVGSRLVPSPFRPNLSLIESRSCSCAIARSTSIMAVRPSPTMAPPEMWPALIQWVTLPLVTFAILANSDLRTTAKGTIPSLGGQGCLGLFRTEKRKKALKISRLVDFVWGPCRFLFRTLDPLKLDLTRGPQPVAPGAPWGRTPARP
jgi:hypothetical protein